MGPSFMNRKTQEKGVEGGGGKRMEANVPMCMCFVDFHPSVWCSSKGGLFHIFVLFTRKSKPYPLAPKANLETKKGGRPERSSSSTGVHSTVSLLIRTHSCAVGPSTRPHWLLPLHKLPPIADHLFEKKGWVGNEGKATFFPWLLNSFFTAVLVAKKAMASPPFNRDFSLPHRRKLMTILPELLAARFGSPRFTYIKSPPLKPKLFWKGG